MKLQTATEDRGVRLDLFLSRHLDAFTRSQIQLLNRAGAIQVEGRQEKAGYRIRGGEIIEVDLHTLTPPTLKPEQIPLQIHFEDSDLAVIDKPAGMVVHPGAGTPSGTMVHALLHHFRTLSDEGGLNRPGIVHRLDKRTSGLMLVAKNNLAHVRLARAFHDREIHKAYITLVHGKILKEHGSIDLSIGRHPSVRTKMMAHAVRGREALSEYEVAERLKDFTLLKVKIRTGRTHQIRVHLSAIGHPVVGDDVYGEHSYREFQKRHGSLNRYFLHSAELRFKHPINGSSMSFTSVLPPELQDLLKRLR